MIEIGDTIRHELWGGPWVVLGYVYYDNSLFYVCVNDHDEEKDLHACFCRKMS